MKNKKIIIPALLFALTAASVSPFISAQAATTNTANGTSTIQRMKNFAGIKGKKLNKTPKTTYTAAEITALKAAQGVKVAAVNAALESGNYDAWVTAVAALRVNPNANVKAIDNHEAKVEAITAKITRENFPKLVEAYNLEKQLQAKLTELGLNKNDENGKGMMPMFGMGLGMGFGLGHLK